MAMESLRRAAIELRVSPAPRCPQACTTAALNYIDVAKGIASIYSSGMPQAVELVRLNLPHKERKAGHGISWRLMASHGIGCQLMKPHDASWPP